MPVGLGPCSQCVDIQARHQEGNKCWGTFPSQWHLQGDNSLKCAQSAYKLSQFDGYYTTPQTNSLGVQDIADNQSSIQASEDSINSSLRWPAKEPNNGVNVPNAASVSRGGNSAASTSSYTSQQQQQLQQTGTGGSRIFDIGITSAPTPIQHQYYTDDPTSGHNTYLSIFSRPFL